MMRHACLAAGLLALAPAASAADIGTDETLGLGVVLGSPTGISGKYYFAGPVHAVEAALATEFFGFGDDRVTGYANYLIHPWDMAVGTIATVPWHIGAGLQVWSSDLADDPDPDFDEDAAFGVRVPTGLDVNLRQLPLQISGDVALIVPIAPELEAGFDVFLTGRYYFF